MNQKTFNTRQSEIVFLKSVMQVPGEQVRLLWKLSQFMRKWMKHFQRHNKCWSHTWTLKIPSNRLSIANLTRSSRSRPIWSKDKSNQKNKWSPNQDTCPGDQSTMWNVFQAGAIITREDQVALRSSITGLDLCKVKNHRLSGRSFRTINLACLTR